MKEDNKMKKIFTLLFLACFLLSCCACGNNTKEEPATDNSSLYESSANNEASSEIVSSIDETSSTGTSSKETSSEISSKANSSKTSATSNSNTNNSNTSKPTTTSKPTSSTSATGEFTVTFNLGYEGKTFTAKSENYKVAKPEEPIRAGYKFLYWYVPDNEEQWSFSGHAVTSDMTLTAKWGKYRYGISYSSVVNGEDTIILKKHNAKESEKGVMGAFSGYSIAIDDGSGFINGSSYLGLVVNVKDYYVHEFKVPHEFSIDSNTFTVPELSFDGCEFLGWTYDGQSTPVKTVTIPKGTTKNYKLVANWKRN